MILSSIAQADLQFSRIGRGARRSIVVRRTNLTGVAQYDLSAVQVDFSDAGHISGYSGERAGRAREVYGVGDDGVQTRGYGSRGGGRLIKGKRVSRFGDPVVLDMEYQVVPDDLGAYDGPTDRSLQVARHGSHGSASIDCAQIRHQHSADRLAMLVFVVFLCGCPCDQERNRGEN